jgi:hypothetical protein
MRALDAPRGRLRSVSFTPPAASGSRKSRGGRSRESEVVERIGRGSGRVEAGGPEVVIGHNRVGPKVPHPRDDRHEKIDQSIVEAVGRLRHRWTMLVVEADHRLWRLDEVGERRPRALQLRFGGPNQRENGLITPRWSTVKIDPECASKRRGTIAVVVTKLRMGIRIALCRVMSEDELLQRMRSQVRLLDCRPAIFIKGHRRTFRQLLYRDAAQLVRGER